MAEHDTKYTDMLVCPCCGHKHSDCAEIEDAEVSSQLFDCEECGTTFRYETETRRTFSSWPEPDCVRPGGAA